ncbi:MAG: NAD(P)-dependent glycerol-3-phosphate dehydrogenase [Bacteroidetes bacterium]|nr:NAD(P)-dependent glycerol-3-phosphate dehydrogenase [Bacteroidota bacterium]
MNRERLKTGIIGAGGWGTALAMVLAENHHQTTLWTRSSDVANEINQFHTNNIFLPDITIPSAIRATTNPSDLDDCDLLVIAVPTQYIRNILKEYTFALAGKIIVSGAKGIERHTLLRVSEILDDATGITNSFAVLTGPSHAEEVARLMPTTVVAASTNSIIASKVQKAFTTSTFRVYSSPDVIGAELGGALKNVIAIAAGIIDGVKMGDNTKAALITRGLSEMTRFGTALGADAHTFSGLSGLGDLYVTCSSRHSRNRRVGEQIGSGISLAEILSGTQTVAEGVSTSESVYELSRKHGVEMPIVEQVYRILFEGKSPRKAINDLMIRRAKPEQW